MHIEALLYALLSSYNKVDDPIVRRHLRRAALRLLNVEFNKSNVGSKIWPTSFKLRIAQTQKLPSRTKSYTGGPKWPQTKSLKLSRMR